MGRLEDLEDDVAALRREVEELRRRLLPPPRRVKASEVLAQAALEAATVKR